MPRWWVGTDETSDPSISIDPVRGFSNPAITRSSVVLPEPADLLALLERRLPPFRALAQRRLVLRGDLAQLRSMQWLFGGG